MSDEKYPLIETGVSEEDMFFSTDFQDQACIGHLRGDFGSGTEFWTTWWDHHDELKDQDFKNELDDVVNTLRRDGPLKNLRAMEQFCRKHSQFRMPESSMGYHGFRVDTARHRYYLRMLPLRGNYNFYIYCYKTDLLEKTIKVLVAEPMKPCEVREIPETLAAMQTLVGGNIEATYSLPEPSVIICNREGKNLGLPYNRLLCDPIGTPYDILCGTFFIAGTSGEHFASLTDEQIHCFKELFDKLMVTAVEKNAPEKKRTGQKKRGTHNER